LHCYVQLIVNTILNTLIDLPAVLNLKCFDFRWYIVRDSWER
jgi:hypothetical protein